MKMLLELDGPLEKGLAELAAAQQASMEDMARFLLRDALGRVNEDGWEIANRRRGELIYKKMESGLDAAEAEELARLQAAATARLAPMDQRLVEAAERIRKLAEDHRAANP